MRIKELRLSAWQVLRQADLLDLSDFVVIAGPNGVGKTKVKEAIVHIFRNSGNPPAGCKVILEATNQVELDSWNASEISLPQTRFQSFIGTNSKRLKTRSRLIQIDSNRSIESVNFQQLTFQAIGNPEEEEVSASYGFDNVKDRFQDICRTLHRLKSKEVTSVYNSYQSHLDPKKSEVTLTKLSDPTEKYIETFGKLLYPKTMQPIDINSTTIQYRDEEGTTRQFSELSSGEREVVILTFDILTQNPDDCLVLIDEPEVHLHPELTFRLIKTLKSIGERNQYFLFTHSPDVIGNSLDTGVHFIRPKSRVTTGNQVIRVDETNIEDMKVIPNIRETIGMLSIGKKLLFVEGGNTSIDRNVFATIAKASNINVAIVPSDSCTNVNNMALMCDTLGKGIFGIELHMVRDRDGLVDDQIATFTTKSKGHLVFLPYYHIENAFLDPHAIESVAKKVLLGGAPSLVDIEKKMVELARQQINYAATLYVKSEIYFKAGNFDVSPKVPLASSSSVADIASAIDARKLELLNGYGTAFSKAEIEKRLSFWHSRLTESVRTGWTAEARNIVIGKRMLNELQPWLFGGKKILLWEHILNSQETSCLNACRELREILAGI